MTQTTVTGNIQQTFNAHLHFTTQSSFTLNSLLIILRIAVLFIIIPLIYFFIKVNLSFVQNILSSRTANTIYIGNPISPLLFFGKSNRQYEP